MKKKILSFLLVAIMVISTVCTGNVNVHAAEDKEEIVYKLLGDFEDCLNGYLEAVNSEAKKEVGEINESVDLDELAGLLKAKDSKSSDKHLTFSYITDEARNSAYYVLAQFVASLTDDINLGTIDVNDTNKSAKNLVNYLKDRTVPAEFTKEHGGYKVELKVTGVFSAYTGSVTVTSLNNKSEKYTGIARSTLKETKKVMTSYIDAMSDVVKDGFKKALISVIQELADVTCLDKYTEKELKKYIDKKLKKLQENEFWRKTLAIIVKSNSIYKQVKSLLNGDIVSKMKTGEISTEELFNSLKKLNYYSDEEVRNKIIDKEFKKLREIKEKLETAIFNQIYDTNCKNYDEYKEKSEDKSLKKAVPLTLKNIKKTLYAGDADSSFKLTASIPANELTWSSTNKKVATVTDDGLVEAVKSGVAVIKVQIGSRKADCTITVKSPSLNKKEKTLNVGGTFKLKMNGSNVKSFISSDKKVATVSKSGVVTAKKAGKAVISAKCSDGKTYKCTIKVNKKKKNNENKVTPTPTETNEVTVSLKKGDYITLGKYEQDNDLDNGKEPIEWEVLDVEGDKALVISRYIIDAQAYDNNNDKGRLMTWENCSLRKFLNETFYDCAFTKKEKKLINKVTVENNTYVETVEVNGVPVEIKNTVDRVFCMSSDELGKYFSFKMGQSEDLANIEQTVYVKESIQNGFGEYWWIRFKGLENDAHVVNEFGYVTTEATLRCIIGIRPAMWVTINDTIMNSNININSNSKNDSDGKTNNNSESTDGNSKNGSDTTDEIRKTITLGTYEQDWDVENGATFTNKPIEWDVLAEEGNKALVITKKVIDVAPYNNENVDVTWENSSLRMFLNEEFYNKAFSSEEKELINQVTLENKDNSYYGTVGGNNTNDKVFCLSMDEIKKYYKSVEWSTQFTYGESWNLVSECTDYTRLEKKADSVQVSTVVDNIGIGYDAGYWWLRSPGADRDKACIVKGNIVGSQTYSDVNDSKVGIRPAMWITIK